MAPEEVAARAEIAALISAYSAYGDRQQWDLMEPIWATDAVVLPPGGERFEGREAIMARFRAGGLRKRIVAALEASNAKAEATGEPERTLTFSRHNLTSSHIEFEGPEAATGISYFVVNTDCGLDHCGTYSDRFKRIDGRWFFAERKTRLDWIAPDAIFGAALREALAADKAEAATQVRR